MLQLKDLFLAPSGEAIDQVLSLSALVSVALLADFRKSLLSKLILFMERFFERKSRLDWKERSLLFLLLVGLGEKGLGCDDRLSFYISQSKDWKAPWVTATSTSSAATDSDSERAHSNPGPLLWCSDSGDSPPQWTRGNPSETSIQLPQPLLHGSLSVSHFPFLPTASMNKGFLSWENELWSSIRSAVGCEDEDGFAPVKSSK